MSGLYKGSDKGKLLQQYEDAVSKRKQSQDVVSNLSRELREAEAAMRLFAERERQALNLFTGAVEEGA